MIIPTVGEVEDVWIMTAARLYFKFESIRKGISASLFEA